MRDRRAPPPANPTGLTIASVSHNSVELDWDDPSDSSITHYEVLRRDRAVHAVGVFVTIDSDTGSTDTEYTDDTVEAEKSYVYRVKAVNRHGTRRAVELYPGRHPGGSQQHAGAAGRVHRGGRFRPVDGGDPCRRGHASPRRPGQRQLRHPGRRGGWSGNRQHAPGTHRRQGR